MRARNVATTPPWKPPSMISLIIGHLISLASSCLYRDPLSQDSCPASADHHCLVVQVERFWYAQSSCLCTIVVMASSDGERGIVCKRVVIHCDSDFTQVLIQVIGRKLMSCMHGFLSKRVLISWNEFGLKCAPMSASAHMPFILALTDLFLGLACSAHTPTGIKARGRGAST